MKAVVKMYEVWVIRKKNPDGSYSYYSHMANGFPEWIVGHDSREHAKHFLTEEKAVSVLKQIEVYAIGSNAEVVKVKVKAL